MVGRGPRKHGEGARAGRGGVEMDAEDLAQQPLGLFGGAPADAQRADPRLSTLQPQQLRPPIRQRCQRTPTPRKFGGDRQGRAQAGRAQRHHRSTFGHKHGMVVTDEVANGHHAADMQRRGLLVGHEAVHGDAGAFACDAEQQQRIAHLLQHRLGGRCVHHIDLLYGQKRTAGVDLGPNGDDAPGTLHEKHRREAFTIGAEAPRTDKAGRKGEGGSPKEARLSAAGHADA